MIVDFGLQCGDVQPDRIHLGAQQPHADINVALRPFFLMFCQDSKHVGTFWYATREL